MSSVVIYKIRSQSVIAHKFESSQKKSQSKSIIQGKIKGKKAKETIPKIQLTHKESVRLFFYTNHL